MKIELITQDFKDSTYTKGWDCPLYRALKRYFPKSEIVVYGWGIIEIDSKLINAGNVWDQDGGIKEWRGDMVIPLIRKANAGEEVSYTLNIPEL